MKKRAIAFLFLLFCIIKCAVAQDKTVNIYYDSTWQTTAADKAVYRRKFVDRENYYSCFTFWTKNNKLCSRFNCLDMNESPKKIGTYKSYFESGQLEDSMIYLSNGSLVKAYKYFETGLLSDSITYNNNGQVFKADHYYITNKPFVHLIWNEETNEATVEAFDTAGKKIEDFEYGRPAAFPGGGGLWMRYIDDNVNIAIAFKNKAPKGRYKTLTHFVINENGDITDIRPQTNFGYGMEDEVVRVLKGSPKWKPAVSLNHLVKAYRIQPVTFIVD